MNHDDALELLGRCLHRIAPEADLGTVDPGEPFAEELDLDSMDVLSLYEALHEAAGIEIPESDYDQLSTLDGITGYLTARLP